MQITNSNNILAEKSVWYALYTKPRFEKKVISILTTAGYEAYLPLISSVRQWSDRKMKIQSPLISSYVFVQIEEKKLNELLKFQGVVRVLKHLGKPAKIKEKEIENLKIICQQPSLIEPIKGGKFTAGTPIQIRQGAMRGLYGECVEFKGKQRVLVSVKNMGLEFVLNVPLSYIDSLNE